MPAIDVNRSRTKQAANRRKQRDMAGASLAFDKQRHETLHQNSAKSVNAERGWAQFSDMAGTSLLCGRRGVVAAKPVGRAVLTVESVPQERADVQREGSAAWVRGAGRNVDPVAEDSYHGPMGFRSKREAWLRA